MGANAVVPAGLGTPAPPAQAARGTGRPARGWPQEPALRMLRTNLDVPTALHTTI